MIVQQVIDCSEMIPKNIGTCQNPYLV